MANRRMFSKAITNSARFLQLPATSRLLYFDLGMNADDEGVVEAFTVMRLTGSSDDDLERLKAAGLIAVLNDDLVVYIVNWSENNYIQSDRFHRSFYHDLLEQSISSLDTTCIHSVSNLDAEVRVGKGREREDEEKQNEDRQRKPSREKQPPKAHQDPLGLAAQMSDEEFERERAKRIQELTSATFPR